MFIYQFKSCAERNDIRWILFFTRSSVDDLVVPGWMGSADASEFMLDVHKLSAWDFLRKKELWACARSAGKYAMILSLVQTY